MYEKKVLLIIFFLKDARVLQFLCPQQTNSNDNVKKTFKLKCHIHNTIHV